MIYSCNDTKKIDFPTEKKILYEKYSHDNKLIGYTLRKYTFLQDTMIEKYISVNLKGEIMGKNHTTFLKKDSTLFIIDKEMRCFHSK